MAAPLSASSELQLVRDRLGVAIGQDQAAAVFMAALDRHGGRLPRAPAEIAGFVDGPLRATLAELLGAAVAARVIARVRPEASQAAIPIGKDLEASGTRARPGGSFLDATTVGTFTGPVRLVVLARSPRLAERLRLSVGADDVAVAVAADPHTGGRIASEVNASMIVIDGTDVPAGGADDFVDGLAGVASSALLVLWTQGGADAESLRVGLEFCSLRVMFLDRREGVQPLIDLIRAQRGTRE